MTVYQILYVPISIQAVAFVTLTGKTPTRVPLLGDYGSKSIYEHLWGIVRGNYTNYTRYEYLWGNYNSYINIYV